MRAVPITVAALAAALLLTACGGGDDSGSDSGESKGAGTTGSTAPAGTACAAADLGQEVAADAAPSAGDSGNVTVTLTNKGAECTLKGFPTVELTADGTSATVGQDEAAEAQALTLPAQGTTTFTITYVRGEEGGDKSLAVKTVKYGLPGASADQSFPWSYGDVSLKSEKVPDATVSAFQQAGD
ncbi:DUF4232 domain-containing protein [Streptomyces sp. NPDC060000]|uniref:DUF4232 domain-containing protein n=1 Tax=Streptomyces sp. NPDC060000 TaxID=3347031 RepID=UPI0036C5FECE